MDADYADRLRVKLGLINAPSLELLRQRMAKAEDALEAARAAMRAAADAAGIARGGLFEGSKFVLRTSGERWANEARAEGHREGHEWLAGKLEAARDPNRERPFRLAGLALARAQREGREFGVGMRERSGAPVNEVDTIQAQILKSREVDLSSNRQIGAPTTPEKLSAAILAAGAKARSATDADPPGATNALAQEILRQGRRRRGLED